MRAVPIPDGAELRAHREAIRLGTPRYAELLGVTRAKLLAWEAGEQQPGPDDDVERLHHVLRLGRDQALEILRILRGDGHGRRALGPADLALLDHVAEDDTTATAHGPATPHLPEKSDSRGAERRFVHAADRTPVFIVRGPAGGLYELDVRAIGAETGGRLNVVAMEAAVADALRDAGLAVWTKGPQG